MKICTSMYVFASNLAGMHLSSWSTMLLYDANIENTQIKG